MVSISRAPTLQNAPRPMNPFRDWGGVAHLMRIAFQSEVSASSLPLLPDWPWLRWLNGALGVVEAVGVETPEQMFGHVSEGPHQIVGNATIGLFNAASSAWLLSNVAVHPSYRRRGIARALVETAIKEARRHGGKYLTLQVQNTNGEARRLYESLGFRTLEQVSEFVGVHAQGARPAAGDVTLAQPTPVQWTTVQSLVAAHLPPALQTYRHALAGKFQVAYRRSVLDAVGELLRGIQQIHWCLLRNAEVVGGLVVQAQLSWGHHRAAVFVQPSARGQAEALLSAHVTQHIQRYASRRVSYLFPSSHVELGEQLRQHGLREVRTLDLMALQL